MRSRGSVALFLFVGILVRIHGFYVPARAFESFQRRVFLRAKDPTLPSGFLKLATRLRSAPSEVHRAQELVALGDEWAGSGTALSGNGAEGFVRVPGCTANVKVAVSIHEGGGVWRVAAVDGEADARLAQGLLAFLALGSSGCRGKDIRSLVHDASLRVLVASGRGAAAGGGDAIGSSWSCFDAIAHKWSSLACCHAAGQMARTQPRKQAPPH